jgi:hypothetical protein
LETSSLYTPFPNVSEHLKTRYSIQGLFIRGFGYSLQDLNINLDGMFSPYVVTKVLECCMMQNNGAALDQSFFWNLTIGKRIECLLTVVSLSDISELFLEIGCGNPVCRKQIQIELSIGDLIDYQHTADRVDKVDILIDDEPMSFRKPTGFDQLKMLKMSGKEDRYALLKKFIELLSIDSGKVGGQNTIALLSSDVLNAVDNALSDADPLINFSISIRCPYCDKDGIYEVKLEEFVHQKLYQVQLNLLINIHRIAKNYHWSEEQILSLPKWRLSKYLSFIENGQEKI